MQKNQQPYHPKNPALKIKVCGMGSPENILEVASLEPDYLGFIFYQNSPRNFNNEIPLISSGIKKTGVFVDASLDFILNKIDQYNFQAVQLHGGESSEFIKELRKKLNEKTSYSAIEIIKVFSIKEEFDFSKLEEFENEVDYFLFDTKGKNKGGNGYVFDWQILKKYPSGTPFFLSGGIGLEETGDVRELMRYFQDLGKQHLLYAVDLNSKFEISPGHKDPEQLKNFKNSIQNID